MQEQTGVSEVLSYISLGVGLSAAAVIVYGVFYGLAEMVRSRTGAKAHPEKVISFERIRYDIGYHLLLGLELLIAADIIRTVIRPSLEELAILGSIVAIRTVISHFLGKEIGRHTRPPRSTAHQEPR